MRHRSPVDLHREDNPFDFGVEVAPLSLAEGNPFGSEGDTPFDPEEDNPSEVGMPPGEGSPLDLVGGNMLARRD